MKSCGSRSNTVRPCLLLALLALAAACTTTTRGVETAGHVAPEDLPILDVAEPKGDDTFIVDGPMRQFSAEFLDDGTPVFVGGGVEVLAGEDESGSPVVWCPHSQIFASADRERVYNLYGQALGEWPRLDRYAVAVRNPPGDGMNASRVVHVLGIDDGPQQTTITHVSDADDDCALSEPVVEHP